MIRKFIATLLLCLPLVASAQMKPGIPISEVVRQAQAELAMQKRDKNSSKQTNIRTQKQSKPQTYTTYNPYDVVEAGPATYHEPKTQRTPRTARAQRQSTEQQNAPQSATTYNPHLVTGAGPATYHEPKTQRTPRAPRVAGEPRTVKEQTNVVHRTPTHNTHLAAEPAPSVYRAPRAPRPIPLARTPRASGGGFDDQLNFDRQFGLSLATNGLMWLMATPNLDLRLHYDKFSLVGSFAYSGWNMPEQKFWWITSLGGELRYDIIPNVYVGVTYNWFNYNIKFSNTGNQGIANAAGIVAGYKLPIGRKLALDFGLGLGYALVENEKYHDEGSVFIRDERRTYGYWGLTKAQISLVWRIL